GRLAVHSEHGIAFVPRAISPAWQRSEVMRMCDQLFSEDPAMVFLCLDGEPRHVEAGETVLKMLGAWRKKYALFLTPASWYLAFAEIAPKTNRACVGTFSNGCDFADLGSVANVIPLDSFANPSREGMRAIAGMLDETIVARSLRRQRA
ncbi:MAG TPA: hypothetical protein VN495_03655, partial [Candidatus Paceibacterota bacterium]|nr:hypothetical protein [Candidatus Paceibacterota bacterium]